MTGNSTATSGWLESIGVGSEVYCVSHYSTWSRGKSRICKITGETPKRWKIGDVQFSKVDGYGFHGSFISEVTDDHRKAVHIAALMRSYRNFCSKIESTQRQIAELPIKDIEIVTSKLKAVVELIENRED